MVFLRLLPVIVSLLLLAAHFMRAGNYFLFGFSFGLLLLLFRKKAYIARLIQLVLIGGTVEWIRTTIIYVQERQDAGEPWIRLMLILGSVSLFTALSALSLQNKHLKDVYGLTKKKATGSVSKLPG